MVAVTCVTHQQRGARSGEGNGSVEEATMATTRSRTHPLPARDGTPPPPADWPSRLNYLGTVPPADGARPLLRRHRPPRTSTVTWRRASLPHPQLATVGLPWSEALVSVLVVPLLFVPVVLASNWAWWSFTAAAVLTAIVAYLMWARRVVVGDFYVAVRQLGRYHVATADHLRGLRLRPSQRGGVLVVHTDDGRQMRLRRVEVAHPRVNDALRALATSGECARDEDIGYLLAVRDDLRARHRFLADLYE